MKIYEYYRDAANINLNGSIAALVPAVLIVSGNISFFKSREVMLLTIPFLIYSLISFQFYLFRLRQSIYICKNMDETKHSFYSINTAKKFLVFFMNTYSSRLFLYFPDGHLAGLIKKVPAKGLNRLKLSKAYALYDAEERVLGYFMVKKSKVLKIEIYNSHRIYLGSFIREIQEFRKDKKWLLDAEGKSIAVVKSSTAFMDEKVLSSNQQQLGRLRRGWMPVEWSMVFPEANTPVLSFGEVSDQEKLLGMSFLINEYFIER
jgi:hypothetical protein